MEGERHSIEHGKHCETNVNSPHHLHVSALFECKQSKHQRHEFRHHSQHKKESRCKEAQKNAECHIDTKNNFLRLEGISKEFFAEIAWAAAWGGVDWLRFGVVGHWWRLLVRILALLLVVLLLLECWIDIWIHGWKV